MQRIKDVFPVLVGVLALIVLGLGLTSVLRTAIADPPAQGSLLGDKSSLIEASPEIPVAIDLQLPGENEIPTLTPRPQPTRDPQMTLEALPVQPRTAAGPGQVLYIQDGVQPRLLSVDPDHVQGEVTWGLASRLDFSPLVGPASRDGRYLILLNPLEPGGVPYVLERPTGKLWPLLQGHPHQMEISGWAYGWHPNHRQVLFWAFNAEALWLVDAESGEVRELAVTRGNVQGAALSPDGRSVVYINPGPESNRAMWWVSTAGGDARVLFDIGGPSRVYSYSPDGQAVLYAAPDGPLWLMDAEGENRRPLAGVHVFGGALAPPSWSPDSQWVAYTGLQAGEGYGCTAVLEPDWETCRYEGTMVTIENIYAGEVHRLTDGIEPVWLKDGAGLVFLSNRTGAGEVWFIDPAGGGLRQLTADGMSKGQLNVLPEEG